MQKDRTVIIVRGGVVQDVLCDKKKSITLIDYDNIESGDGVMDFPPTISSYLLDRAIENAEEKVKELA